MKFNIIVVVALVYVSSIFANDYTKILEQFDRKNYDKVLKSLDSVSRKDKEWFKIRGTVFHEMYVADSAAIYLKESFDLGKKSDNLLILLAESLAWIGDYKNSQLILDMVKNKNKMDYLMVYATLKEREHDFAECLKIYNKILKKNPNALNVLEKKGVTYGWLKDFDKAIRSFSMILKNPKATYVQKERALLKRAEVYAWSKNKKAAFKDVNKLLKDNHKNLDAILLKATWYEWEGNYKKAKGLCESVVQIDPENKEARHRLEKLSWVK